MEKFFENKKAVIISGILIVLIIAAAVFLIQNGIKRSNDKPSDASQSENIDKSDNAAKDEKTADNKDTTKQEEKDDTQNKGALKEGESLEGLVNDFNTLPEGEEKEKVRKRLEEILAAAEAQSPANSAN